MKLSPPVNQKMEVLHELLLHKKVSRKDFLLSTGILNPTARLSELRNEHFLTIKTNTITVENKFGRKAHFAEWSLPDKTNALKIYKQFNR
jgi:hypothetical protein